MSTWGVALGLDTAPGLDSGRVANDQLVVFGLFEDRLQDRESMRASSRCAAAVAREPGADLLGTDLVDRRGPECGDQVALDRTGVADSRRRPQIMQRVKP